MLFPTNSRSHLLTCLDALDTQYPENLTLRVTQLTMGVRVLAASAVPAGTPEDSEDTCDLLGKGSRQSPSQLPGSLFMSALRG